MDSRDGMQLYGEAILTAMDRVRLAGVVRPHHQAEICLAIRAAVEEAFCHPEHRGQTSGFLDRLNERTHAALAAEEARSRQPEEPIDTWMSYGDE